MSFSCFLLKQLSSILTVYGCSSGCRYLSLFFPYIQYALFFVAKVAQDASSDRDREFSENLDGMLQDPDYDIRWNVPIEYTGSLPEPTTSQPPAASSASS